MDLYLHTFGLRYNYRYNGEFDVFAFLDLAAACGFRGVNISVYGPEYPELSGSVAPRHLGRIRDRAGELGLGIDVESNGTGLGGLADLLDLARKLGAGAVRTYATDGETVAARTAIATRDLIEAARLAEKLSIPVVFENHEDLTGKEVADILGSVNSPWIGALFDYGNSMVVGEEPLEAVDAMAPWARTGHLKDQVFVPAADGTGPGELHGVPVGAGVLPVREITERLIARGVGKVCVENTWGYSVAVADWRGGASPGRGSFTSRPWPEVDGAAVPDARSMAETDLLNAELAFLRATITGLQQCLAGLPGIVPVHIPKESLSAPEAC